MQRKIVSKIESYDKDGTVTMELLTTFKQSFTEVMPKLNWTWYTSSIDKKIFRGSASKASDYKAR